MSILRATEGRNADVQATRLERGMIYAPSGNYALAISTNVLLTAYCWPMSWSRGARCEPLSLVELAGLTDEPLLWPLVVAVGKTEFAGDYTEAGSDGESNEKWVARLGIQKVRRGDLATAFGFAVGQASGSNPAAAFAAFVQQFVDPVRDYMPYLNLHTIMLEVKAISVDGRDDTFGYAMSAAVRERVTQFWNVNQRDHSRLVSNARLVRDGR